MPAQTQNPFLDGFNDPEKAATYSEGPTKFIPGFSDVHHMVNVLLQERLADEANVLVHGAGGGLELDAFARANPNWSFLGVDPAQAMVDEARKRVSHAQNRVEFHCGMIDDAPDGPFDGATSLLTLHFLEYDERLKTTNRIVQRLKKGAPFVAVHSSVPQLDRDAWLSRYAAFAVASGVDPEMANSARKAVSAMLPILEPQDDERILRDAGLENISRFYQAFTWVGWVGYAP